MLQGQAREVPVTVLPAMQLPPALTPGELLSLPATELTARQALDPEVQGPLVLRSDAQQSGAAGTETLWPRHMLGLMRIPAGEPALQPYMAKICHAAAAQDATS